MLLGADRSRHWLFAPLAREVRSFLTGCVSDIFWFDKLLDPFEDNDAWKQDPLEFSLNGKLWNIHIMVLRHSKDMRSPSSNQTETETCDIVKRSTSLKQSKCGKCAATWIYIWIYIVYKFNSFETLVTLQQCKIRLSLIFCPVPVTSIEASWTSLFMLMVRVASQLQVSRKSRLSKPVSLRSAARFSFGLLTPLSLPLCLIHFLADG